MMLAAADKVATHGINWEAISVIAGIMASIVLPTTGMIIHYGHKSLRRMDATADVVLGYVAPDGTPVPGINERFDRLVVKNNTDHAAVEAGLDALAAQQKMGRAHADQRHRQNSRKLTELANRQTKVETKVDALLNAIVEDDR
jgi:hypothetical protein